MNATPPWKNTSRLGPDGFLVVHTGLKLKPNPAEGVKVYTYSRDEGDFHAADIRRTEGHIVFDLVLPDGDTVRDIAPGVPVEINIENTIAALAALWCAGERDYDAWRSAMASFRGPKRRFEFHYRADGRAVIDDYAHHPDELRQSILSVRALYPGRRLTVAFQPHLYTRTRDFAPQFAEALSLADEVVLLDIYPARELPIEGVSSRIIFDRLTSAAKRLIHRGELPAVIAEIRPEILLTAGAGDIVDLLPEVVDAVRNN